MLGGGAGVVRGGGFARARAEQRSGTKLVGVAAASTVRRRYG